MRGSEVNNGILMVRIVEGALSGFLVMIDRGFYARGFWFAVTGARWLVGD